MSLIYRRWLLFVIIEGVNSLGILYPYPSETRQLSTLDGVWQFIVSADNRPLQGFEERWYKKSFDDLHDVDVLEMTVPSSYNDITVEKRIRDHVGLVWYQRTFFIPKHAQQGWSWVRFGSVSYAAQVWINGQMVVSHEIGHLPFLANITDTIVYGKENRITVACDNTLLEDTVPQGRVGVLDSGRLEQQYTFDFFNYAGIDRSVVLYTTPTTYIDDITISTETIGTTGIVTYTVTFDSDVDAVTLSIRLLDHSKQVVGMNVEENCTQRVFRGVFEVAHAHFWWPRNMDTEVGYRYTLQVELLGPTGKLIDIYRLPIGIRQLQWSNSTFTINDRPIYLYGFGKHEDFDVYGKGLSLAVSLRDFNLIKWVGANSFRTSHYPYAEEIMELADQHGIMVIDECPSVNTEFFGAVLLEKHKRSLTELIQRDKNRPSVIMWSAANEPRTQYATARDYFRQVIEHIRQLDNSRPTTIVEAQPANAVYSSEFVDIINFNRYNAWYTNSGDLDVIMSRVISEANTWRQRFQKPVIMQEYGADTLEGLHILPEYIWSEEFQMGLMSEHFKAFDYLRHLGYFIGEFYWNFADFKTAQTYTRVGGNKKGIFTRNRQPKSSAFLLRKRYWQLSDLLYNETMPNDLDRYTIGTPRDEL